MLAVHQTNTLLFVLAVLRFQVIFSLVVVVLIIFCEVGFADPTEIDHVKQNLVESVLHMLGLPVMRSDQATFKDLPD